MKVPKHAIIRRLKQRPSAQCEFIGEVMLKGESCVVSFMGLS